MENCGLGIFATFLHSLGRLLPVTSAFLPDILHLGRLNPQHKADLQAAKYPLTLQIY